MEVRNEMATVLEYAQPHRSVDWKAVPKSVAVTLLTYAHVNLGWQFSRLMLVPVCERLDSSFMAWTPVAWLPGGLVTMRLGAGCGAVVMFLTSLLAARIMQDVLVRYQDGAWGRGRELVRDWRVWATVVLWMGWVPVPAVLAFVFQFREWAMR